MALGFDYRKGLAALEQAVSDKTERDQFGVHIQRLRENLDRSELFGDTPASSAERSEIIFQLNSMTRKSFSNTSFADVYEGRVDAATLRSRYVSAEQATGMSSAEPPAEPTKPPKKTIRLTTSEYARFKEILGEEGMEQYDVDYLGEPVQVSLRFTPTNQGARIRWESVAFGGVDSDFTTPYPGTALAAVIKALDALQYPAYPAQSPAFNDTEKHTLERHGLWKQGRVTQDAHKIVGRTLFDALTQSRESYGAVMAARGAAVNMGTTISYLLRFPEDAIDLAALPWEAMWDQNRPLLLSQGGQNLDSCERYLDVRLALKPPLPRGKQLHILALSPHAGIPEQTRTEERTARIRSWEQLKAKGLLDWDELSPVTATNLYNRLRDWSKPKPDIVHFFGHGTYENSNGFLYLDNAPVQPTASEMISASQLSAMLGDVRLIVIHACRSAMVGNTVELGGILTGVAPALATVSEAVVAMQLTVRITAAIRFQEVFYEELTRGQSLQSAVSEARRSLYVIESDGASWYVPTLYIRTREQKPVYLVQPVVSAT